MTNHTKKGYKKIKNFKGGKMKKISVSVIASLIFLGLAVSAKAGYVSRQNDSGQRYQMRHDTGSSDWTPRIGVGFNRQMYTEPATPGMVAPTDISLRVLINRIGGEFDLGGNQYGGPLNNDANVFDVALKAFYAVVSKEYVNFNAGMTLMYSDEDSKTNGVLVGTGVNFFAGPEFFIPQIPELGFNIELGLGYTSYSAAGDHFAGDNLGFNGADFLQAGIHYYFN